MDQPEGVRPAWTGRFDVPQEIAEAACELGVEARCVEFEQNEPFNLSWSISLVS
jgi:hypothetical protein